MARDTAAGWTKNKSTAPVDLYGLPRRGPGGETSGLGGRLDQSTRKRAANNAGYECALPWQNKQIVKEWQEKSTLANMKMWTDKDATR